MRITSLALGALLLLVAFLFGWINRQGLTPTEWRNHPYADIVFDTNAIATVRADSWLALYEAQGFIEAAERMWQMDLMRRKAAGRLSEWFGAAALPSDISRRQEDWSGVVARAYQQLPKQQKTYLDAYTQGVNRFIAQYSGRWGVEYGLLRVVPELWRGEDSLLILLQMCETLTQMAPFEAPQSVWREHLSAEWQRFIFPDDHPWNVPEFGQVGSMTLPPQTQWLPTKAIDAVALQAIEQPYVVGSNNWAWRGTEHYFLANDPHLGINVPNIWYAVRLRKSAQDWIAGVSIPGVPGVIIGMNPSIGWTFTNTHEDVDDLFLETLDADNTHYQDRDDNNQLIWRSIEKRQAVIKIKDAPDKTLETWFTHRGPLQRRAHLGEAYYSRAWLPLKAGLLSMPTIMLGHATDWRSFNQALDDMRVPALHVIMMDREGGMGYRAAGVGVLRRVPGHRTQPGASADWLGVQPVADRLRIWSPAGTAKNWLATANQRVWVTPFAHGYAGDERIDRIRTVLSQSKQFQRTDMQQLQLDTHSRYHKLLIDWMLQQATVHSAEQAALFTLWNGWDGDAQSDPATFAQAQFIGEQILQQVVKRARVLLPQDKRDTLYTWRVGNALVINLLSNPQAFAVLGMDAKELANWLLRQLDMQDFSQGYQVANRWRAQHPFVKNVPVIGQLFAIEERNQVGNKWVLRAESPRFGPSMRVVWDLQSPLRSVWSLPIGQSGHVASEHFDHFQQPWFEGDYWPVLDDRFTWR